MTDYAHHPTIEIGWSSNAELEDDMQIAHEIFLAMIPIMRAHGADKNLYMHGTMRDHDSVAEAMAIAEGRPMPIPDRHPECVKAWPDCESGAYDPRCCRFPKSCSCRS